MLREIQTAVEYWISYKNQRLVDLRRGKSCRGAPRGRKPIQRRRSHIGGKRMLACYLDRTARFVLDPDNRTYRQERQHIAHRPLTLIQWDRPRRIGIGT